MAAKSRRVPVQARRVGHGAQQPRFLVPGGAVEEQQRHHVRRVLITTVPGVRRPQRLAAILLLLRQAALPGGVAVILVRRDELGRDEPVERPPVRGRRGIPLAVGRGPVAALVRQRRALQLRELREAAGVLQEGTRCGGGAAAVQLGGLLLEARRAGEDGVGVVGVARVPCSSNAPWRVHGPLLERSAHHPPFFLHQRKQLISWCGNLTSKKS
jgi:hypothetical protein